MKEQQTSYEAVITLHKSAKINYTKLIGNLRMYKRSVIEIGETPEAFSVKINAADPTALKASFNSILRDIQVIESVRKVKVPQMRRKSKNI